MKKSLLFFAVNFLFLSQLTAQDKGYIAISMGASAPMGDFASKNSDNEAAGWASTGAIFDISFGYKLGKNFGVTALLRGQANATDAQAMADEVAKQMPPGSYTTVESGIWSIGGFMIGGLGSFPISEKLSFEGRLMFGFLTANSPVINIDAVWQGNREWIQQSSSSAYSFTHLLGVGFKYDAGKRVCLLANFDYLGSKPEFRNVEILASNGLRERKTFNQTFGTINFGIGLGFRL